MFFEAQIITQELKKGNDHMDKQGHVYLYPESTLGQENLTPYQTLTYLPYESSDAGGTTFKAKLAANAPDIQNYFSVNPQGQLVLATLVTTTVKTESKTEGALFGNNSTNTTYQATEVTIDYKNMISQYATPMSFYLELGMVTRNPEFLAAVVGLVKAKTNIQLTVLNTTSTDITVQVDEETKHIRGNSETDNSGTFDVPIEGIYPYSSDITTTTTTTTTVITKAPSVKVTSVDTWICSQKITYNKIPGTLIEGEPYTIKQESEEAKSIAANEIGEVSWITRKDSIVTTSSQIDTYDSGIASDYTDNTDAFIALLDNEYTIPNSKEKRTAGAYLKTDAELFFQLLSQNSETQGMEQVMRYIMYKYDSTLFPKVDLDFGMFDPKEFQSVGVAGGSRIAELLKSYENDPLRQYMNGTSNNYTAVQNYVKQDKSQYKLYYTKRDGCLNFSYGIMVRNASGKLNNVSYFSDEGLDLQALINQYDQGQDVYVDAEIIDRIYLKILNDRRNIIKSYFDGQGISLKEHEVDALVNVSYQYGNCGQYISGDDNIANLYSKYYTKGDKNSFKSKAQASTGDGERAYIFNDSSNRKKNNWLLFSEGRYILNDGTELEDSGSDVVQFALQFVGEGHSRFTSYNPKNGVQDIWYGADWCAMFVSYCYNECGLIPDVLPKPYAGCGLISELYNAKNPRVKIVGNKGVFKGVKKDSYTPKPGDIIFFNWNGSGARVASHTGIVTSCDGTRVYTVEGNAVGGSSWSTTKVGAKSYSLNDGQIVGYISINGN